jgi:hypothetical protein
MFVVALVFFGGVWLALPPRPPTPPTRSASATKLSWLRGVSQLVRRPLRPCWRPFGLRFPYATSVLVTKY